MTTLGSPWRHSAEVPSLPAPHVAAGRGPSWLDEWLFSNSADLVTWRRHIHAHPELAHGEYSTTALIAERLCSRRLWPTLLPGATGLICDIGTGPRCVALRADLDALPLPEAALASAPALPGRIG